MTDNMIKAMVSRFLTWRLPDNFQPDGGISFKSVFNENTPHQRKAEPTGTNLFDAQQAEAMVRHMLEGAAQPAPGEAVHDAYKDGWGFAYRQWQHTGSVPDPSYTIMASPTPPDSAGELDALVAEIKFESVNSEIDRALAGRIITALRAKGVR